MLVPLRFWLILLLLFFIEQRGYSQTSNFLRAQQSTDVDSAIYYGEKELASLTNTKDSAHLVDVHCFLADKYSVKSRYTRSEKLLQSALSMPFVKRDASSRGKVYRSLGTLNKLSGNYGLALENLLNALTIFEQLQDWNNIALCQVELAEYHRKLGEYDLGRRYLDSATIIYERRNLVDTLLLIRIYNRAAAIENESSVHPNFSIVHSRRAIALAEKIGDINNVATSMNEIGFSYKNLHVRDSAEYYYRRAEELWFSIGADREAINAMYNRTTFYLHEGYPFNQTFQLYQEIIRRVESDSIDYPLDQVYGNLFGHYIDMGDSIRACYYLFKYHAAAIAVIEKKHDIQIDNISERYENEKQRKEVERISLDLNNASLELERKNTETRRNYIFITVLSVLIAAIAFLLYRIFKANKKLEKRDKEKDALIQEIHHRVKNNLQFISSLMNMQMNSSSTESELRTLGDASRRIKAMALVHELLYNQGDGAGIQIKDYISELSASLQDVINSSQKKIRFDLDIDRMTVDVSTAVSLGMIASELISNSMKHAFADTAEPVISVRLKKTSGNEIHYTITDNGCGLQPGYDEKKSLGMRLINIFSRQLNGEYSLTGSDGCKYDLKFVIP